jgi:hypothetical protein
MVAERLGAAAALQLVSPHQHFYSIRFLAIVGAAQAGKGTASTVFCEDDERFVPIGTSWLYRDEIAAFIEELTNDQRVCLQIPRRVKPRGAESYTSRDFFPDQQSNPAERRIANIRKNEYRSAIQFLIRTDRTPANPSEDALRQSEERELLALARRILGGKGHSANTALRALGAILECHRSGKVAVVEGLRTLSDLECFFVHWQGLVQPVVVEINVEERMEDLGHHQMETEGDLLQLLPVFRSNDWIVVENNGSVEEYMRRLERVIPELRAKLFS